MRDRDSAAPPVANPRVRPAERPVGPLRFVWEATVMGWRWLVRMRTALYLLAVLGLMSLLATVVPQQPNVPTTVAEWRSGEAGPGTTVSWWIDLVGGYDVYGSGLFLALLLLLFLSLTACLIPRIRAWVRLVRRSRPPLARDLTSMPLSAQFEVDGSSPDEALDAAGQMLRSKRWRVRAHDVATDAAPMTGTAASVRSAGSPPQIAAEKGLVWREGGSLLFHVSFYVLLAAVVFGQLTGFEGQRAVIEGEAFADAPVSYWVYRPGRWFGEDDHTGFLLRLDRFEVDWVRDPSAPGAGQPTTFRSEVTVTTADGDQFPAVVEGNRPLSVDGRRIHQLDWGYAPKVEVEIDGELVHEQRLVAMAADGGFFRGAAKVPSADPDLGLEVFFFPFAPDSDEGPLLTGAPWDDAPLLMFAQWRGDLQLGRTQQTINQLDTTELERTGGGWLRPGQSVELPDGVVVRFVDLDRWVGFQVSSRPQLPWLALAGGLILAGLLPALYAYRRRLWVAAVRPEPDGPTLVRVAGRAFQRPQAFEEEHAELTRRLAVRLGAERPRSSSSADDPVASEPSPAGPSRW